MIYFQIFTTFRYKSLKNSDIIKSKKPIRIKRCIIGIILLLGAGESQQERND